MKHERNEILTVAKPKRSIIYNRLQPHYMGYLLETLRAHSSQQELHCRLVHKQYQKEI